jgi:XTP/dITP diphosphohydrolase
VNDCRRNVYDARWEEDDSMITAGEILIASSNRGKLRDFAAAAAPLGIRIAVLPYLDTIAPPREVAPTYEANAFLKAEYYSRFARGKYVLGDDSGLEVDALGGEPGVHSARYAAISPDQNATDAANNAKLLAALEGLPDDQRGAHFVCVIAVAQDGRLVRCFLGEVTGRILPAARGVLGFGYDSLFYFPEAHLSFGELPPEQKAEFSHRGRAFRKFLNWYSGL